MPASNPLADDPLLRNVPCIEGWKVLAPAVLYSKLGQGGMGAVYRGRHVELGIDVAVKCLKPSLVSADERFVARFRREARLAAELDHENLVRVYELRRAHGISYLILEFVDGETAKARVQRKGPLAECEAAMLLLNVARGLSRAHGHASVVVHRDIKPDNILVSKQGQVKLADLGIAKALDSGDPATMATQGPMGTPNYMAPEQWDHTQSIGPATDIWAMGVTLYFLLTGTTPVPLGSAHQIAHAVCNSPFPDIRGLRPELSEGLFKILGRCTQRDPKDRYPDAHPLVGDLLAFLQSQAISLADAEAGSSSGREQPLTTPLAHELKRIRLASAISPRASPEPAAASPAPSVGGRRWLAGLGLGAVGAAGLAAMFLFRREAPAGPALFGSPCPVSLDLPLHDGKWVTASLTPSLTGRVVGGAGKTLTLDRDGHRSEKPIHGTGEFALDLSIGRGSTERIELAVPAAEPLRFQLVHDALAPQIEILEPSAAERCHDAATIPVRIKVDDPNLARVEINGVPLSPDERGTWSAAAVGLRNEGLNELAILAEDWAGNQTTAALMVTRDTRAPRLSNSIPRDGSSVIPGREVLIELNFDEALSDASIAGRSAPRDGGRVLLTLVAPSSEGPWIVPHEVLDIAGNRTTGALTMECASRSASPTPMIVLERELTADGRLFTASPRLTLRGRVEHADAGTIQVEFAGRGLPAQPLIDGAFVLDAPLELDRSTQVSLSCGTARLSFETVQDSNPPRIRVVAPVGNALLTQAGTFDLSVEVVETNLSEVLLGTSALRQDATGLWVATGLALEAEGPNRFPVLAHDKAGTLTRLELVVTRDSTQPLLTGSSPDRRTTLEVDAALDLELTFNEDLVNATLDGRPMSIQGRVAHIQFARIPSGGSEWMLPWRVQDAAGNVAQGELPLRRRAVMKHALPRGWKPLSKDVAYFAGWPMQARESNSGIVFLLVKPGKFMMGSPPEELQRDADERQREVEITRPFYLAESEVTQEQFASFGKGNPSHFRGPALPVERIDWDTAREFCLSIGCDLPTEAQWEYACRAGSTTAFSFGPTIAPNQASYNHKYIYAQGEQAEFHDATVPVKSFPPNAWGFYDMHGNVFEWCLDAYRVDSSLLSPRDPLQTEGDLKVLRSGSYGSDPGYCRSARRIAYKPGFGNKTTGIRPARNLE